MILSNLEKIKASDVSDVSYILGVLSHSQSTCSLNGRDVMMMSSISREEFFVIVFW